MHSPQSLGPLEQQLLELVWQHPNATCREIHTLASKEQPHAYTTVMTILNRLVEKGIVTRQKHGKAYTYSPTQTQTQFIQHSVQGAIRSLINRFGDEAITAFIAESHKLSATDRQELLNKLPPKSTRK